MSSLPAVEEFLLAITPHPYHQTFTAFSRLHTLTPHTREMGGLSCVYVKMNNMLFCRSHECVCRLPPLLNRDYEKCKKAVEMGLAAEAAEKAQEITQTNPKLKKWAKKKE
ncbi:hypothetical protein CONLIGDRAFT_675833 [Coniochaeta ligniaria NRRL 30616]|uniref:Uncharacterized protein n=1 Tax=Coniochaeta ligniaria NRRL 30616 TaxID=1408157 RepID=A0A1J7JNA2_9PEZI|nr:hypothetical protein CONLIGDRAFT_675833 [Coniochaeta ligniaria NRRL 30616]